MLKLIFPFCLLLLICSCGEQLSKHEILYNQTGDTLAKYKSDLQAGSESKDLTMMNDYLKLDYETFKSKYKLNDGQMDLLAQSYKMTIGMLRAFKNIEDNIELSDDNDYGRGLDSLDGTDDYSFDPKSDEED